MSPRGVESDEVAELPRRDAGERDGIAEDDHAIPLWFNLGFYGLIAVGIAYILWYAALSGWSQHGQYQAELAAAATRRQATVAALPASNPYRGAPAALAEGKQVFETICVACHKPDASGLVGPSLVDPYWKYGRGDAELFQTLSGGRPAGMPAWGSQLGTEKIWKVLAYLETLPTSDQPGVGAPDYSPPAAAQPGGGG